MLMEEAAWIMVLLAESGEPDDLNLSILPSEGKTRTEIKFRERLLFQTCLKIRRTTPNHWRVGV